MSNSVERTGSGLESASTEVLEAPRAGHSFVFRQPSEKTLMVSCNCPYTLCNYRCSYCYLDHDARNAEREQKQFEQWERVIDRIVTIPRPLILSIGTQGEPLASRPFWDTLRRLSPLDHVKGFWFPTNMSRRLEPIVEGIDVSKLGITASLHPSEFRKHDRDLDFFFEQCQWVVDRGGDIVINFILTPDQLDLCSAYRYIARERGFAMTVNVFKGEFNGQEYPGAYTPEEHEKIKEFFADRPIVHKFMSGHTSYGVDCTAGRDLIHVEEDGSVYNCPFAREHMGSIDDPNLEIRTGTSPCSTSWCRCHWTIGLMSSMVERYKRTKNILRYEVREPGDSAENAFA